MCTFSACVAFNKVTDIKHDKAETLSSMSIDWIELLSLVQRLCLEKIKRTRKMYSPIQKDDHKTMITIVTSLYNCLPSSTQLPSFSSYLCFVCVVIVEPKEDFSCWNCRASLSCVCRFVLARTLSSFLSFSVQVEWNALFAFSYVVLKDILWQYQW